MAKYATGKYAKAISDRSGMEFPYREMVREWNGSFVHVSEFEPKQPQLEPKPMNGDTVRFRNVVGSPGGVAFTTYENASGFSITVTTANKYTFTLGATPSITEESGGVIVSAGPVTITP